MNEITINGIRLASPVEITAADEIIWSSSTGRSASGIMAGDIIAAKRNISINWGVLTQVELNQIKNALSGTFYPCVILGETLTVYRGTLQYNLLGTLSDGVTYYKSASVSLIQQ